MIAHRSRTFFWLRYSALIGFCFVVFIFPGAPVEAASLSFSPASGSYAVKKSFSVTVYVSTPDQSMNAASGVIDFPADKVQVTGVSKSGSVINLWVQEPTFSNSAGTVSFEGLVLNPGFVGGSGKLFVITFKTIASGTASIRLTSASVLANDGNGTNILVGVGSAKFEIPLATTDQAAPQATTPVEALGVPSGARITSTTHPDPEKWYSNNDPTFAWALPAGTTGINFLVDRAATTNPGTTSDGLASNHGYANVDEGTWYMHLRLQNTLGWGAISHFRFQVDTQKPSEFSVLEVPRDDQTNPVASFTVQATDVTSGIDYYQMQVDDGAPVDWRDDGGHVYQAPAGAPGAHTLLAKVFDKAGNSLATSVDFTVAGLESPKITDYQKELTSGDVLIVRGTTYPNLNVLVWLQHEDEDAKQYSLTADEQGKFIFVASEHVRDGVYKLWTAVVNEKQAQSRASSKVTIYVSQSAFGRATTRSISVLSVAIPLVGLVILSVMMLWYFWHRYRILRTKLRKEVRFAEQSLHKSFEKLRENVRKQIKSLEHARTKRELTAEEAKVIRQLSLDLDEAERTVAKEIEDINR